MSGVKPESLFFIILMITGSIAFHVFSRYAKGNIDPLLAAVLCNAAALGACAIFYFLFSPSNVVRPGNSGIIFSLLAGTFIGVANFAVFAMYKSGMSVSISVPLTRSAVAVGAVVLGVLLFSEKLNMANVAGIVLSIFSIFLLAM